MYYHDTVDPDWETQVRGALFAAGTNAVASHRTAGALWDLDGVAGRTIEMTVPYGHRAVPEAAIVHRTRRPLPTCSISRIPVTTIERTLLDLASILPGMTLEKAVHSATRKRLTTPRLLWELAADQTGPGVRGSRRFRWVLGSLESGGAGSPAELDLLTLLRSASIPLPVLQYRVQLSDGTNLYPDFAWPDRMKLVEIDGLHAHASADSLDQDLIRQNALLTLGWEIRRFSARTLRRESGLVVREIVEFVGS